MNEFAKTGIFVALAAVAGLGATWAYVSHGPQSVLLDPSDETGKPLFPDFKDPLAATSLAIVDYDTDAGQVRQFRVEQQPDGKWVIPSKANYPADAQRQLEEAAASVIDLVKLGVVTDNPSEHALFSVVQPDPEKDEGGLEGVGKLVTLANKDDQTLAEFIIGKEDPDQKTLHYVRLPGQDRVYRVKINVSKLSTRFGDWLEKDLLKLDPWNITDVVLNNYSINEEQGTIEGQDVMELSYDDKTQKWSMGELQAGEELVPEKLNDMKSALDQLRIIDVDRKSENLRRVLRGEEERLNPQDQIDLQVRGFFLAQGGRLLSNEGEVIVQCKDGVEYVLRFGEIAAGDGEAEADAQDDADGEEGAEAGGSNRYIFAMAQFNPDLIPHPDAEAQPAVPDAPADTGADDADADGEAEPDAGEGPASDEEPDAGGESTSEEPSDAGEEPADEAGAAEGEEPAEADQPGDGDEATDADEPDEAGPSTDDSGDTSGSVQGATQSGGSPAEVVRLAQAEPAEEAEDSADEEPAAQAEEPAAEPESDEPAAEGPAAGADEEAAEGGDSKPAQTEEERKAEEERKKKEEERKRKLDEYNEKIKKGEARVKELNDRFADWFYIVADSVYRKIHVTRADIIKGGKPALGEGGVLEELDEIKAEGPQREDAGAEEDGPEDGEGDEAGADETSADENGAEEAGAEEPAQP
jgi:hypothetical protein